MTWSRLCAFLAVLQTILQGMLRVKHFNVNDLE